MRLSIPVSAISATLLLAACGRQSAVDEEMKRDLEAASAATVELAPNAPGTRVVSAIESKQPPQVPKVTPVRRVQAPAQTPPPVTPQVTQTSTEPTATRPMTTRPATAPAVQPPPPGGYKSVGEVIRNAPFPIKPATKRP